MTSDFDIPYEIVDAFTGSPFSGNPAAVCILTGSLEESVMQNIAAEMNLAETAFVHLLSAGGADSSDHDAAFGLRWFTPKREVPLCGHATLAAAHVLFETVGEDGPLSFATASGIVTVERGSDGLVLDFPSDSPRPAQAPTGLLPLLGLADDVPAFEARNMWMVRIEEVRELRALKPDFGRLRELDIDDRLGVIVTTRGDEVGVDIASRVFAPWVGIDEDPVTGVAHTIVGPYWAAELDQPELRARQLSKRGGELIVRPADDRIFLEGRAVTVARGSIRTC